MNYRFNSEVRILLNDIELTGELIIPQNTTAIVIFSHGSGSSRFSNRNQKVATFLQEKQTGTLLFDLLTEAEDQVFENRFNIDLLSKRLAGATEWLENFPAAKDCRIGYFGASTGAASALQAAAMHGSIGAVVSRGGRPDLAERFLPKVMSPTLLIVGSRDTEVLALNKQAYNSLTCLKELVIVEGATHLFEEEGKLDEVAVLAAGWFEKYL